MPALGYPLDRKLRFTDERTERDGYKFFKCAAVPRRTNTEKGDRY